MTVEVDYSTTDPVTEAPITGAVAGVYSQNTAHVEEAISHLTEYFKHGPRNQALVTAINEQVQEMEDTLWAMSQAFLLDTAVGDQLDLLGSLVGEGRQDRTDAAYRAAIRVRILVNKSEGLPEQLLEILEGINSGATHVLNELYPASLHVESSDISPLSIQQTYRLLQAAKPAGVRLSYTAGAEQTIGAADGSPAGGEVGSADGSPAGAEVYGGT